MYLCARGIGFPSFYDFDYAIISSVVFFVFHLFYNANIQPAGRQFNTNRLYTSIILLFFVPTHNMICILSQKRNATCEQILFTSNFQHHFK
jgi:hypothetical protein